MCDCLACFLQNRVFHSHQCELQNVNLPRTQIAVTFSMESIRSLFSRCALLFHWIRTTKTNHWTFWTQQRGPSKMAAVHTTLPSSQHSWIHEYGNNLFISECPTTSSHTRLEMSGMQWRQSASRLLLMHRIHECTFATLETTSADFSWSLVVGGCVHKV